MVVKTKEPRLLALVVAHSLPLTYLTTCRCAYLLPALLALIVDDSALQSSAQKQYLTQHRLRTIQISGDQTLEELHHAIFDAFDREEEHIYEFQVGGKGTMDPQARRYVLSVCDYELEGEGRPAGVVTQTTIGSLGLKVGVPLHIVC